MERMIEMVHNTPKVAQPLCEILNYIKARESVRYALENVGVNSENLCATDGRRLFVIKLPTGFEIAEGIYHLTGEGYLLKTTVVKPFPENWEEFVLKEETESKQCYLTEKGISDSIQIIAQWKIGFNFVWLQGFLNRLVRCDCPWVKILKPEKDRPVYIIGAIQGLSFQYVQMPYHDIS